VGYPRALLVDKENGGFYHVMSRCVRRAWLCGVDPLTGQSFEHRRQWIEDRLLALGSLFAAEIYAYAVMNNHYHIVLYIDPHGPEAWSAEEVARRWVALTPPKRKGQIDRKRMAAKIAALIADDQRLGCCRQRLGDLSWFMRFLNEPIARRANREDGCKGRFWEGRFESQALLDARAVYGCMTYVDLNPVRAAMTKRLQDSAHTSIKRRLASVAEQGIEVCAGRALEPLSGDAPARPRLEMTELDYLALVDWTGRRTRPDKPGAIPSDAPAVLASLCDCAPGEEADWIQRIDEYGRPRQRAFGAAALVEAFRARLGRRWRNWLDARMANT
jgi:putative transposase